MFELRLMGQFQLTGPSGPVELKSPKLCALLGYLACLAPRRETRDRLATLFWGSHFEAQAQQNLRQALARLRKIIGAGCLLTSGSHVWLADGAVSSDLRRFQTLAAKATRESLHTAVTLLRGDLLAGIDIGQEAWEEWLSAERRRLHGLAADALVSLGEIEIAAGNPADTLKAAERALEFDPYREDAHRLMMRAMAQTGRRAEALRHFQALSERLKREFDTAPEPASLQCRDAIRAHLSADTGGAAPPGSTAAPAGQTLAVSTPHADKPSIAVLSFANLSGDSEQQYFSDGITEDIITELSRFRSLFVIARISSLAFNRTVHRVQDIARELGVAYVVEGSVRRAADRVRITAQLIDAGTGNHLWAERYDRDLRDIFALQEEVARSIASTVSGRVEAAGRERAARLSLPALRAYDLVLRARALTSNQNRADNEQAIACAERAVELDPSSGRAHAVLARNYFYNYMAGWTADRDLSLAKAFELARRAVALDETDSFSHSVLGIIHMFRREYDQARLEHEKAIDLNPNDPDARRYYGDFLAATGSAEAAIEHVELGKRLNPFDTRWVPWITGLVYFSAHRYDEAIAALKQARDPINEVRGWLAASYAHAGRLEEAKATLEEFLRVAETDMAVFPGRRLKDWERYWHGALEYRDQKDFDHLFEALRKAGLPD